ncbi:MAG: alpha/beta hydrolase, partial [Pseudomonadota bacterium]
CEGAPSEITVWFEAGAGGSHLDWRLVAPEVAKFARVCSYDRAGLGWSDKQSGARDLEAILGELDQVIQSDSDSGQVIMVGHSFGGFVGQAYARKYPEKVAGLVLVDSLELSFYEKYADQSKSQIGMMRTGAVLAHFGIPRLLGLAQAPADTPEALKREILARAVRPDAIATVADEAAVMPDSVAYFKTLPDMASDMPVTIISRAISDEQTQFDLDWREGQTQLSETYPDAQWIISDSENHYVQIAEAELIVGRIRLMINGISGR